jgi:hypothetical protein
VLYQAGGGGFESDNHTIAASYTSITGMEIAPEPIDPVPGGIIEVGNGGTLVSDTPAEIGSGSEVIVDMGGQIEESAPIVIESGGVIVDNGTITDSAPVEIHMGGGLLGEGTIDAPLVDNSGMLVSTGRGLTIDGSLKEETSGVIDMLLPLRK